jgi:hypothetical protein
MTYESYIKARLVDFAVEDAFNSGGVEAMLAVAQVLKNRVDAGWQGSDWRRIIRSAPHYRGTVQPSTELDVDPRDGNFRELISRIDDVYHGTADDANVNNGSGKSLYYAELHNINRPWFKEHILDDLESHPRIASVGQLTFFA